MNKIEVIQFFIADSAVLFFHVRIIAVLHGPTSGTKVTFAALLASVSV